MSKQANVTVIGGFVIGAVVLVVAGLLLFGSGKLMSHTNKFVLFFEGTVKGLNPGAPVTFSGVRVGSVTAVKALFNVEEVQLAIVVFIEIDPASLTLMAAGNEALKSGLIKGRKPIELLVEQGLRAQLQSQSLVTGLLFVDLDFYPDTEAHYSGLKWRQGLTDDPELPTIPSTMESFSKALSTLNLDQLIKKVELTIDGIERIVNSPNLQHSVVSLDEALTEAKTLLKTANTQVEGVGTEAKKLLVQVNKDAGPLLSDVRGGVKDVRELLTNIDKRVGPIATSLDETLQAARKALKTADTVLVSANGMIGDNSGFRYQLGNTLDDLSSTARSFRVLADYLEQNPDSLIRGKKNREGK
jgi:paraquat-inducible protein B